MASKDISTVDYTDSFNTFFVKDVDDIRQISKDNVKTSLGIGVVTGVTAEAESTLTLTDSAEYPIELHLYGKSTQDGTPTPDNPIEIVNVTNPTVTINNGADLSQIQQFDCVLRGVGEVKDELVVYADGSGKLIQRLKYKQLKSSDGWKINGAKTYYYSDDKELSAKYAKIISNYFKTANWNVSSTNGICQGNNYSGLIGISAPSFASVDDLKKFLDEHEVYALCVLAEPIITELTAEQMKSYYPVTNIFTDQSAGIKAVYTADTKGYIDRKFDELATALVAQTSEQ